MTREPRAKANLLRLLVAALSRASQKKISLVRRTYALEESPYQRHLYPQAPRRRSTNHAGYADSDDNNNWAGGNVRSTFFFRPGPARLARSRGRRRANISIVITQRTFPTLG